MYVVAGVSPVWLKVTVSRPTVSRALQLASPSSLPSTWKPLSLSETSVHWSPMAVELTDWASRSTGASGGTSSVVAEASSAQGEHPKSLQARRR